MDNYCKNYCGVACVNGSCPMALDDQYAERERSPIKNCSECFYYNGCEDCYFSEECERKGVNVCG